MRKLVLEEALEDCQSVLEYRFRDPALLHAALTHSSGADHKLASNQRLEFLGDAVLGLVVCEMLYQRFPDLLEGDLTRIKSHVVSRQTCGLISRSLGLESYLILGKGMGNPDRAPHSVLSDVFESLVGAIYLDGGLEEARRFLGRHVGSAIDAAADGQGNLNFKSDLQHATQRSFGEAPIYLLLDEKGPDHSKCFKIAAMVAGKRYAAAWGSTKKDAEQRAARNALAEMAGERPPFLEP